MSERSHSMLDELTDLFRYNRWANGRMLDASGRLTPEELTRHLGGSFPSVLETLRHMGSAEWIWLERWRGRSPSAGPPGWEGASLEELMKAWAEVADGQEELLSRSTEQRLMETVTYTTTRGERFTSPLWKLMRHVVNHATHHRGQVVAMLRQLGGQTPNTDLITYFRLEAGAIERRG